MAEAKKTVEVEGRALTLSNQSKVPPALKWKQRLPDEPRGETPKAQRNPRPRRSVLR